MYKRLSPVGEAKGEELQTGGPGTPVRHAQPRHQTHPLTLTHQKGFKLKHNLGALAFDKATPWGQTKEPRGPDLPEQQVPVGLAEVVESRYPITELVDDVYGGGEEGVELGDAGGLAGHQARLAVHLLLRQVGVLGRG